MAELLFMMPYMILSATWASIYHIYLSAIFGLERLDIFGTAMDILVSACLKLLPSLAFAILLFCLSVKLSQPVRPFNYEGVPAENVLADNDNAIDIAYEAIVDLVRECEILDERSERDRKYAEEICKERQLLIAQKTVLENRLGDFESFSELERSFKELEWQLEVERQHRRAEEKNRRRLYEMAQRANSDVILARSFTIALNLEWQVAKTEYLERLEVLDRERHHAMLAEIASQKELRAMRGMTRSDQTVDDRIRLSNEEIDRLRAKLQIKTTACDVQLADKDKKIHDLELNLRTAQLDYAELEENLGLIGYSDEGVEGAEGSWGAVREEGRAGNMNEDEVEGGGGDK